MVMLAITQCQRLDKGVQAKARDNSHRHFAMHRMGVTVFNPHGDYIQRNLHKEPRKHQRPDQQRSVRMTSFISVLVIKLRQQVDACTMAALATPALSIAAIICAVVTGRVRDQSD